MGSLFSSPTATKTCKLKFRSGSNGAVTSAVPLATDRILSGHSGGTVAVWSVEKRELLLELKHGRSCTAVGILTHSSEASVESDCVALAGASDGTISAFSLPTGRRVRTFSGGCGSVQFLFALDDVSFVSGHESGWVQVWDFRSGQRTHHMRHGRSGLKALTVQSRDSIVSVQDATTTQEGQIQLASEVAVWSIAEEHSGKPRGLTATKSSATNVSFLVSAALDLNNFGLALGGTDGSLQLWLLSKGEAICDLHQGARASPVQNLSRAGEILCAAYLDGTVAMWRLSARHAHELCLQTRICGASIVTLAPNQNGLFVGRPEPRGRYHCGGAVELWSVTLSGSQLEVVVDEAASSGVVTEERGPQSIQPELDVEDGHVDMPSRQPEVVVQSDPDVEAPLEKSDSAV